MSLALFIVAAALLAYTYAGFPLLVLARGALFPRRFHPADITPPVSIVIAAHDEAAVIGAKVANLLELDYPDGRLEIVIASDGSGDGTDAIVRAFTETVPRPVLLVSLPRVGKAAALTAAFERATGEILVFSDANSMYAPDAIRALTRPFADPGVGGVAGDQRYLSAEGDEGIASGERSYWSFDRVLKQAESRGGSVISATGAIYAIRRSLFQPVRPDVTDDFYTSTGVIEQGRRLVFAPGAAAFEPVAASGGDEYGRKVRVMTRGLRGVIARRALLNPFRYGFYAVQLLSHKVLRRLMAVPLVLLVVTGALLWERSPAFVALTLAQAVFYTLGALGLVLARAGAGRRRVLAVPAFFCLVNAASVHAVWNVVRGNRIDRWQPKRTSDEPRAGVRAVGESSSTRSGDDLAWRPKR